MRRFALMVVAALLLTACPADKSTPDVGGLSASVATPSAAEPSPTSSEEAPQAIDLSGTWEGTWANTTPDQSTGTFKIEWEQSLADALDGTITITGTPCLTGGKINGSLDGQAITFGVVNGQVEVSYEGSVNGDGSGMRGTYSTSCGNAKGSWEATKVG